MARDTERSRELTRQANALRAEGRWQEALPICRKALEADPNNSAAAHNLAVMLSKMGELAEGEAMARRALELSPDTPLVIHALAHNLLSQGRYQDAWPLYEVRARMPELNTGFPTDFPYPRWRGESLKGKRLAVFPEQGLGDQIQFARFLPRLIEQADTVTLLTLPPLERLFQANFSGAEVLRASGNVDFPDPDYWTTLHDLPGVLNITLGDIPTEPYLRPPGIWPDLGAGFKVGLKAKGNPLHINDAARSLPAELGELLRQSLPGKVISLEPDESGVSDMADTAAIIAQLDIVVAVDTSVAHLAGAMGKPCLVLLPGFGPDWRWMFDRTDSPWYPNHRLYRTALDNDWRPAVERLIGDVKLIFGKLTVRGNTNRAITLRDEGKLGEALAASERALAADPSDAIAAHTRGVLLSSLGRLDEGEALFRAFLEKDPHHAPCRHGLAMNLLTQGRYREAWPYHDARIELESDEKDFPRDFPFPRWCGEDLRGKRIAVFPEQGFGDQIQFARFLPELVRRGAKVVLLAKASLARLFAYSFPDIQVVPTIGSVDFPDPDYWATLVDLPAKLGVELETIPDQPYLRWREVRDVPGEGLKIGLKLTGNPKHRNDAWRSLPPDVSEKLRDRLPGTLVDLEPDGTAIRDFADTAAIVAGLDLVISVDTSVAHLAGAMGKPCFLLLSGFDPDWRWMRDRTDSPWYPKHRLYRGMPDGNWSFAIDALLKDIPTIVGNAPVEHLMAEAQALRAAGEPLKALAAATRAAVLDPNSVSAAHMHGVFLSQCGRLVEGETLLRRVLEATPDLPNPRHALGANLLAQGRYREGWALYDARTEREGLSDGFPRDFPYPRWTGEDLKGKRIVVFPEQGYGDQIQFARFIPRLAAAGAEVIVLAAPPLFRLFERNFPSARVLAATGSVDFPDPDYWATLADLPGRFDAAPDNLIGDPYLRPLVPPDPKEGGDLHIGLVTQGNPNYGYDNYRSLPVALGARLRKKLPGRVIDLSPEKTGAKDFADTAAVIAGLDLVISVDTAVAHLAGAMGKKCLLLLGGFATDWRWMRERTDSPWYREHILYRADIENGWGLVVDEVVHHIEALNRPAAKYVRQAERLREQRRFSEAATAGRKAVAAEPSNPTVLHNLARLLNDLGRASEAEALQRRAVKASPGDLYRYGLSLNLLAQGRYQEAWPLYEARARIPRFRAGYPQGVKFPRWEGEDIRDKRIAIFPEQGIGDQLQFARFLPRLRERCADMVVLAPPPLVRLFQQAFPDLRVVKASGTAEFPKCAVWSTCVELGRLLDVRLEDLPSPEYLRLDRQRPADEEFRIGFMAKGNPGYSHDAYRSLPGEAAGRLRAALPGSIVDLDPAATGAKDFLDTAMIIADLDLVVSVDTAVGHLAGVMGKTCCLLVPGFGTDWRWLRDRSDSPWYPRHRLFRAGIDGNWDEATEKLVAHVRLLAAEASRIALGDTAS